jgi:hypothetical protein
MFGDGIKYIYRLWFIINVSDGQQATYPKKANVVLSLPCTLNQYWHIIVLNSSQKDFVRSKQDMSYGGIDCVTALIKASFPTFDSPSSLEFYSICAIIDIL